jgi:hypothetical protein
MDPSDPVEAKFLKSLENKKTENIGLSFLLQDPRIQVIPTVAKQAALDALGVEGSFGPATFDAIMTAEPVEPLGVQNVGKHVEALSLLEMKTTKKPIKNANLNGFFFGATEREYELATHLGDRYRFAFVVLSNNNEYGRFFAVLLALREVARRTRARRVQYQVNFKTDTTDLSGERLGELVLPPIRPDPEP